MRGRLVSMAASALLLILALGAAEPQGKRWALLIGIDGYQTLGRLEYCAADARALADVLVERCGYDANRVVVLTDGGDDPARMPTLAGIRRRIAQIASLADRGDTIVVFFSGHGITHNGEGYLVPVDGDAQNAVSLTWVKSTLEASEADCKLLILDACHAGSAAKGVAGIAPNLAASGGLVMLLSSARDQVSYPDDKLRHSVFTYYLITGLSGQAAGEDEDITAEELYRYTVSHMKEWSFQTGRMQTPVLVGQAGGRFVLARVPEEVRLAAKRGKHLDEIQWLLDRARQPMPKGKYDRTVGLLKEILSGYAVCWAGMVEEAKEAFVRSQEKVARELVWKAQELLNQKRYSDALALLYRPEVTACEGLREQVQQLRSQVLRAQSQDRYGQVLSQMDEALSQGNLPKAEELLGRLCELALAGVEARADQPALEKAISDYERIIERKKADFELECNVLRAYLKQDKLAEAHQKLRQIQADWPGHPAVKDLVEQVYSDGLGLHVQTLTPESARKMSASFLKGVVVTEVDPDSPAARYVKPGDVIASINRRTVTSVSDYINFMGQTSPGSAVLLQVWRPHDHSSRFIAVQQAK